MSTNQALVTTEELANYLGVSVRTVQRLTAAGSLPHYKVGRSVRYRSTDIERWLFDRFVAPVRAA